MSGTVTLNSPALADVSVALVSAIPAVAPVPPTVTVPAGATVSAPFLIATAQVLSKTAVKITATRQGVSVSATLTINPVVPASLNLSSPNVGGGDNLTNNFVTLTGPAPAGGAWITLTSNSDVVQVPPGIGVSAGATVSDLFIISTKIVGVNTSVVLGANYANITVHGSLLVEKPGNFTAEPLVDFQPGDLYLGLYQGNLYEGSNAPPVDHDAVGQLIATEMQPLDANGNPSPTGQIVMTSIGPSVTTGEFCAGKPEIGQCAWYSFVGQTRTNSAVNHTTLVVVDGAHEGEVAAKWICSIGDCNGPNQYDRVRDTILTPAGFTEQQVQAVWIQAPDIRPSVSLPASGADALIQEGYLGQVVRALRKRWPNVKQVFFSSLTYTGYSTVKLDPEPYAYEGGFAVKWLIEAQIVQRRTGQIDPIAGDLLTKAPFIAWGPYLWGSGTTNPAGSQAITWIPSDFIPDGVHCATSGVKKVAGALMNYFLASPYTPWFRVQ